MNAAILICCIIKQPHMQHRDTKGHRRRHMPCRANESVHIVCLRCRSEVGRGMATPSVRTSAIGGQRRLHLRRCCNKIFFDALRMLISTNQILLLVPIAYHGGDGAVRALAAFRPQRILTICTALVCVCFSLSAPFLVRVSASIYGVASVQHDALFVRIAVATLISDVATSLLIWAAQIWQRCQIAKCLNAYYKMLTYLSSRTDNLLSWQLLAFFWLKLGHALYESLQNVPFLYQHAAQIDTLQLLAYVATMYLQALKTIFALDMFAAILLLTACFWQLEMYLKWQAEQIQRSNLEKILIFEENLHSLAKLYTETFQFPILLLLVYDFINFLANLYAVLYHFIYSQQQYASLVIYCASLAVNLYSIIFCAHLCTTQHQRVKDLLLCFAIDATPYRNVPAMYSDPNWSQPVEFTILGMFSLSNNFWLALVSYSANFIVIILQFAIKKAHNRKNK